MSEHKERPRVESHEQASAVVERLRQEGYFRQGENAKMIPRTDETNKWFARVDVDSLWEAPPDPEWKRRFPVADALHEALEAEGFRVDVWPDYDAGDGTTFRIEYFLYEGEQ